MRYRELINYFDNNIKYYQDLRGLCEGRLDELRRNPELNPKFSLIQYLEPLNKQNVFVHFSDIPKLGIKPKYTYGETPFGIYGWPISYIVKQIKQNKFDDIPFSKKRYIIVFEYTGNKLLDLKKIDSDLKQKMQLLKNSIKSYTIETDRLDGRYKTLLEKILKGSIIPSSNKKFYEIVNDIVQGVIASSYKISVENLGILWNKFLRNCGYDAVLDDIDLEDSRIYDDEPPQFVSLIPSNVKVLKIIDSKITKKSYIHYIIIDGKKYDIFEPDTWPKKISGDLDLSKIDYNIKLPDNLSVGGYLDLRNTTITQLPDNLSVGGSLYLYGTKITQLPDNLSVGGYLNLRNTKITQLPDNLSVGGYLDLRNTKITQLPDNLSVGGYLDLSDTKITQLPDNLSVRGNLYLTDTKITQLPDNLSVGGDIYISPDMDIEVPPTAKIGGEVIRIEDD